MTCSVSPSWDTSLVAYLSGNADITEVYRLAKRPLERIVARLAPFMGEDLREDAVQNLFVRLIENPPAYDPSGCSARALTFGLLRNAIRQVRAAFAVPGQKTRIPADSLVELHPITVDDFVAEFPIGEGDSLLHDVEQAPSLRWTSDNTQAFVQARELLAHMPPDAGTAVWLVHGLQYSITEAATILNRSRFAIARSLKHGMSVAQIENNASAQL